MGVGILQALIPPPRTPKIIFSNQSNLQFSWNPVPFHGSIPSPAFRRTFRSLLPIFRASGGNSNQVLFPSYFSINLPSQGFRIPVYGKGFLKSKCWKDLNFVECTWFSMCTLFIYILIFSSVEFKKLLFFYDLTVQLLKFGLLVRG